MALLTERYSQQIAGTLSCYDRIVITGTIPQVCYAGGMTSYLYQHNVRILIMPRLPSLFAMNYAVTLKTSLKPME